jgi:ABC-type branched-subunit amino acid transport system substrate-binding protein
MSLAGDLHEIAFPDVMSMCAQLRCTGRLVVTAPRTGEPLGLFYFDGGELVDAEVAELDGEAALYYALAWDEGLFRFDLSARARQRRIFKPVTVLLLEGTRRLDEARRDGSALRQLATEAKMLDGNFSHLMSWRRLVVLCALVVAALGLALLRFAGAPETPPPASIGLDSTIAPSAVRLRSDENMVVHGVSDQEIVLGMSGPFSGPVKEYGRLAKLGFETAFNLANDAGGVNGRKLRLVTADDGYEPARALETMKDLYEQKRAFAFVGNVGTPTATVSLPFVLEHRMILFGAFTGAGLLRRDPPDRYVFNFRASYAEELFAIVKHLVKVRHVRAEELAVFAQQDAFGDAGYAGVMKAMRALRPELKSVLRLNYKRNTIDVSDALAGLRERAGSIRAVVLVATYRAAARFIEKTHRNWPHLLFASGSYVDSAALAEEMNLLGTQYGSGVIVTAAVPTVDGYSTAVLKYKAALARYFPGEKAADLSLEAYLSANLFIEGLRRAGPKLDTEKLVDALESIHDQDLGLGSHVGFGPVEHQASHKVWGAVLDDSGHYQVIDLE